MSRPGRHLHEGTLGTVRIQEEEYAGMGFHCCLGGECGFHATMLISEAEDQLGRFFLKEETEHYSVSNYKA
jgi:hypothetical protein